MPTPELEARLARLERENRRLRWAVVATLAVAGLVGASQVLPTAPVVAQQEPQTIVAERFLLRDPVTGAIRGSFGIERPSDTTVLQLDGPGENPPRGGQRSLANVTGVTLSAERQGAGITVTKADPDGISSSEAWLGVTPERQGQLILRDARGAVRFAAPQ